MEKILDLDHYIFNEPHIRVTVVGIQLYETI